MDEFGKLLDKILPQNNFAGLGVILAAISLFLFWLIPKLTSATPAIITRGTKNYFLSIPLVLLVSGIGLLIFGYFIFEEKVVISCHIGIDAGDNLKGAIVEIVGREDCNCKTDEQGKCKLMMPKSMLNPKFVAYKNGFEKSMPESVNTLEGIAENTLKPSKK